MYHGKNSKSKITKEPFIWCLVLVAMAAIAVGDVEQSPAWAGANESIDTEAGSQVAEGISTGKTIQSITFKKNVGIRDALRFLAAKYQKNIVPSPEVDGQLAFTSLFNVTLEEAMNAILGGNFEYEQVGNLIEVYGKGDTTRMKYRVFALNYVTAAEARKLIEPVLSSSGKIGVTTAAQTGVPTGESISSVSGGGDTMSLQDTLVVYDYAENIRKAGDVITTIDVRPQQVLVEATILSATLTEDMQLGIDWSTLKGAVSQIPGVTAAAGDITAHASDYFKSAGTSQVTKSGGMTIGLAKGDIAAFIEAVEEVTDTTVLANPKILAVNKQLGQVYIGTKLGYRETSIITDGGATQEGTVKFLDTGTKLSFRPYISDDGYIRMDIHSKDSSGELNAQNVPDEIAAELVTNVMVQSGQTIVIGGLFRDVTTSKRTQIPLLGDLPIIGALFRGTADYTKRQEVIVLLTPHIIEEPSETEGQARVDDVRRKRFGAKDELQWIGRARLAEDRYAKAAKYYIENDNEAALRELNLSLELRPAYLEAIRLKERILGETDPSGVVRMERNVLDVVEQKDTDKWLRR